MQSMTKPTVGEFVVTIAGCVLFGAAVVTYDSGYAIAGAIMWATSAAIEGARRLVATGQ